MQRMEFVLKLIHKENVSEIMNSISALHSLNIRTFADKTDIGIKVARSFAIEQLQKKHGARIYLHMKRIFAALKRIETKVRRNQ